MSQKLIQTAGGVVLNFHGQILIIKQRSGIWSFPKGHIDRGESNLEAAKREIFEESGVSDLEYIKDLGSYVRPSSQGQKQLHFFLFKTRQLDLKPQNEDSQEAKWVNTEEVADILSYQENKNFFLGIRDQIDR